MRLVPPDVVSSDPIVVHRQADDASGRRNRSLRPTGALGGVANESWARTISMVVHRRGRPLRRRTRNSHRHIQACAKSAIRVILTTPLHRPAGVEQEAQGRDRRRRRRRAGPRDEKALESDSGMGLLHHPSHEALVDDEAFERVRRMIVAGARRPRRRPQAETEQAQLRLLRACCSAASATAG
jgi:hypothetical protein